MAPGYGGNNPYAESFSYTGAGVSVPAPKGKKGPVILLSIALVMVPMVLTAVTRFELTSSILIFAKIEVNAAEIVYI